MSDAYRDKLKSLSIGQRHKGTSRERQVIADDGALRGQPVGTAVDHWDGRTDAHVRRAEITINPDLYVKEP